MAVRSILRLLWASVMNASSALHLSNVYRQIFGMHPLPQDSDRDDWPAAGRNGFRQPPSHRGRLTTVSMDSLRADYRNKTALWRLFDPLRYETLFSNERWGKEGFTHTTSLYWYFLLICHDEPDIHNFSSVSLCYLTKSRNCELHRELKFGTNKNA